ncbi:MAG: CDP-diacylglycerol--glycerol-3-phosphate 3-phosphatidyltransferase [Lachnospiraceae bacterium]|nr:CDP-diacylglycerol--glycerol-3-phosphate 3-phosphatidyltransferase [Lachnospiraceae bacterium]
MNLPNKLTLMRILMVPAVVVLLLVFDGKWAVIAAAACYLIAAVTDFFDGKIARKYNLVTNFGKFMDPLADKLLVCSTLVAAVALGRAPAWAVIIVIAREFAISGFRLIAVERGVVIAAGWSGKIKTTLQNIWCIGMLIPVEAAWWKTLTTIVMILAVILTVYSFLEYLFKNQQVLKG